jgi:hypothetical protein
VCPACVLDMLGACKPTMHGWQSGNGVLTSDGAESVCGKVAGCKQCRQRKERLVALQLFRRLSWPSASVYIPP